VVAFPPTDRFGEAISEQEIEERSKQKELRILFLGNVIERKGVTTLLEAVKGLRSKVIVDVVGGLTAEPEYTKTVQTYISENDLSSLVFLHGPLNNQPLIDKLRAAHVLVVPSSYEGFGIVYLEGMGFGLPAIGTTLGAAGEVIEDGVTGFLIQPGDAQGLANRLEVLAGRRDVLLQMSLAARGRYLRQPKWHQTAGKIREFLRSFL
jgi:glycosyltransferase involved in cell wall biosynthesis